MKEIRAIDLCCGAGGWACAARGLPIRITHAFDVWPVACKTYEINHPDTRVLCADIRGILAGSVIRGLSGDVDLVLGGIPCEQITIYRNGWNPATKCGTAEMAGFHRLLDCVLDLVRDLAPRWWCIEEVVGVAKHLPPLTPYREIDAAGYSAQNRRRVYVGRFPAPTPGTNDETAGARLRPGPFRVGARQWQRRVTTSCQYDGQSTAGLSPDKKSPTICNFGSRRDAEMAVIDERLPGRKRQLAWQEAALLQGFPNDFLFYGSETAVWKMIAQAIQVDTGRAILEAIIREASA